MEKTKLKPSELILNDDGSIYHIHLREEHIADTVIVVGDQGRVRQISRHFDRVDFHMENREFTTHTGVYKGLPITVMSTGIGTDNIDIAINELDAAVNIDLKERTYKETRRSLDIIRIGTSGALHPDIPVGSFLISEYGLGFDGLMYYYHYDFSPQEAALNKAVNAQLDWHVNMAKPYITAASPVLFVRLQEGMIPGITATATGFYGPQGRRLRLDPYYNDVPAMLGKFAHNGHRITNFEMETSALFGLGNLLGHRCCTCCAIIANRTIGEYSDNYKKIVDDLIVVVLDRLAGN